MPELVSDINRHGTGILLQNEPDFMGSASLRRLKP
jgi:hypothetical protein